eukprot:7488405-Pyramimonas_sp.AAC.1
MPRVEDRDGAGRLAGQRAARAVVGTLLHAPNGGRGHGVARALVGRGAAAGERREGEAARDDLPICRVIEAA